MPRSNSCSTMMDYDALRAEQAALRARGHLSRHRLRRVHRGHQSVAPRSTASAARAFPRRTAPPCGSTRRARCSCHTGVTEQGQGAEAVIAQIAASAFGVPIDRVRVITGDTDNTPYGGGTWASRGAGIGGEAALQAGKALRENVLDVAARILQATAGRSRHRQRRRRRRRHRRASASRSTKWRASSTSAPTRCRPASRPS